LEGFVVLPAYTYTVGFFVVVWLWNSTVEVDEGLVNGVARRRVQHFVALFHECQQELGDDGLASWLDDNLRTRNKRDINSGGPTSNRISKPKPTSSFVKRTPRSRDAFVAMASFNGRIP